MSDEFDTEASDIERRIEGEFMKRLQESAVSFDVVESMEGLLDEEDFGGEDRIIDIVENVKVSDGN